MIASGGAAGGEADDLSDSRPTYAPSHQLLELGQIGALFEGDFEPVGALPPELLGYAVPNSVLGDGSHTVNPRALERSGDLTARLHSLNVQGIDQQPGPERPEEVFRLRGDVATPGSHYADLFEQSTSQWWLPGWPDGPSAAQTGGMQDPEPAQDGPPAAPPSSKSSGSFSCSECEKSFKKPEYLRKHAAIKHGNWWNQKYNCESCQQGFRDLKDYNRHMKSKIHSVAVFCCRVTSCRLPFTRTDNRRRHERKIHGRDR